MEDALEEIGLKEKYKETFSFLFFNSILLVSSIQETIFNVWGREILLKDSNKGRSSEYKEERDLKRVYRSRTDRAQ